MDESQIAVAGSDAKPGLYDLGSDIIEEEGEPLSVKAVRLARLLWLRRKIVVATVVFGVVLSLVCAFLQPNIYTSITSIMPPDNTSSFSEIMSMSSSSPSAGLTTQMLGLGTSGGLFISILQSRNVQDALVTRFDLMHQYKVRLTEEARRSLAADTTVTQDRLSSVITVSVRAKSPQLAADLAQGYVTELNRVVTNNSTSAARRERMFLEQRVNEVKQNLDDAAKALSQFSTKSGAIDMPSQAKSMVDAGLKLETELIDGRSELAGLQQTYSADNSRVRAVKARNSELEQQIEKMGGMPQGHDSSAADAKSVYPSADELPALGLTYYDLERRVNVDEALWETLTKEYESAKVQEAKEIPQVRVLDGANVPERKSGPPRALIVLTGTILFCVIACISVYALTIWEEMDPQNELKKLLIEAFSRIRHFRH